MFSIFHEDEFNQQESDEDFVSHGPLDVNRDIESDVNNSRLKENVRKTRSSEFPNQESSYDSDDNDSKKDQRLNSFHRELGKSYKAEDSDYSIKAKPFQNWDVLTCREQIDHIANCCTIDIYKKIDQIKLLSKCSEVPSLKFNDRFDNLCKQRNEFDKFVSSVQAQCTLVDSQNSWNFEKVIENLQRESVIFKQFFPAYGFRQEILDAVKKNQIVMIHSSQVYSLNVALPLILYSAYQHYSLIACEANEVLSHILQDKINFVTSHFDTKPQETQICVLSENELLKRYSYTTLFCETNSCVIFNVSLKKSITADIILSDLRDLLIAQRRSKLILLLSPQDNVSKFEDYFASKMSVSVLRFPDLSLPVKTIWKEAISYPQDDFVNDLIRTIFSIHAVYRESGDIIVFIPSLEDVQIVYDKIEVENGHYQYNLKIICIDDDLIAISKSVRDLRKSSERKIFLLLNNYEGLSIPSARFVIDCGIQKESYFDTQTDTDIVRPTFISQPRAKMRKYLAGMNNSGVCFRLYNKSNYVKQMHRKEYAEIFCINPIQSVVMTLQHCPQKCKSIQFIESLPGEVLSNTLNTLKAYGAVDKDLSLTSFGENIVKLPLPMKYSRLILHGIQSGFAFEAVILVAFFTVKSELFFEAEDAKNQRLIDLAKLDFYQSDCDTLAYINIYKQWKINFFTRLWCTEHFINFNTLRSVRCKTEEIIYFVHQCLDRKILQQFSEDYDQNYLIQVLFECFHNKLCTFSGHPRTGYRILSSGQYAWILSSSFLLQKDDFPEYIIYEDVTSSDPNYIKHLTAIPFDMIMDYLHQGKLNFDSSDLFDSKLIKRVIDSVGDKVICRFLPKNDKKKIEEVENKLKKETNAHIVIIEPVLEKGSVNLYAFPDDIDNCLVYLKQIISDYIKTTTNDEETKKIVFTHRQNKVSFETKWIKGAETVSASYVLISLNPALQDSDSCVTDSALESSENSSINYTLKVNWPRRVCTGEGYLNFKTQNSFHRARLLAFKNVKIRDYEIFVQVSNLGKNQLWVSDIPSDVTETDIRDTFSALLPNCEFEVELCYTPPFETSDSDLREMKRQIEENCVRFSNINNFEVKMVKPNPSSKHMSAYINVFEKRCLKKEARNLSKTKIHSMRLSCEPMYFSEIKCSVEVYNALKYCMKEEIDAFLQKNKAKRERYCLKEDLGKDYVTLKLSSDDIEVMKLVQIQVNDLLNGVRLDNSNVKNIHKLFCHGGHVFLKTLGETEKVYITENYEAKIIRLFGSRENCNCVRQHILNFLTNTENEVVKNIILCDEKHNRLILKATITQYGANLEKFIESCKLRSAALNLKTSCLSVYGTRESVEKAEECIKQLSGTVGFSDICDNLTSEEVCPVCLVPADSLSFRLQYCGHLYCHECIKGLIEQAQFPIQCSAESCSKPIILGDIKYILNDDIVEINELAEKSLKAYLVQNRDKVYYCPAPDCSMFVYKDEVSEDKWTCPLCKNSICISCNVVYHEGFDCDMYRESKKDPDHPFKVWQIGKNIKRCPNCDATIEKDGGCSKVFCINCKTQICWICSRGFRLADDAYDHITTAHPGRLFEYD